MPAEDTYSKRIHLGLLTGTGIHLDVNFFTRELGPSTAQPKAFCSAHKLLEMWDGKRELMLIEEQDLKLLEARGGQPINNCFQVGVNALEPKPAKVRERGHDWRMRELPFYIEVTNR